MTVGGAVRGALWWITSVMGDHDYARYVAHRQRVHPGCAVPTEREYWRRRHADSDATPVLAAAEARATMRQ